MKRSTLIWTLLAAVGGGWLLIRVGTGAMAAPWHIDGFWLWVSAGMTLGIFSFLVGDNPYYKFTESLFVGVSAAYWMVQGLWTTIVPNLLGKLLPGFVAAHLMPGLAENGVVPGWDWSYLVPLAFGILLLWRLMPTGGWISRWSLALILGITAGLLLIGFLVSDFVGQVRNGIMPLVVRTKAGDFDWGASFSNIVTITAVVSGLVYFYFSKEHKGLFGRISKIGIWSLMISFGAGVGYTVMGRIALLVGRFEFLLFDWLKLGTH